MPEVLCRRLRARQRQTGYKNGNGIRTEMETERSAPLKSAASPGPAFSACLRRAGYEPLRGLKTPIKLHRDAALKRRSSPRITDPPITDSGRGGSGARGI